MSPGQPSARPTSTRISRLNSGRRRTTRPTLEILEDRTVLDGTVKLQNGILSIIGTAAADSALVKQVPGANNQPNQVVVTLNGQIYGFKVTQVDQIQAQLLGANDTFTLDNSTLPVTRPLTVDGG